MKSLALVAAILTVNACGAAAQPAELTGHWKADAIVSAAPVVALDGQAAGRLVGQELVVAPDSVQFAGKSCSATFDKSQQAAGAISRDYNVNAKSLKLPDPATVYDAGCTDIFVRDAKTIVFTWAGYFFQASRVSAVAR